MVLNNNIKQFNVDFVGDDFFTDFNKSILVHVGF